MLQAETLSVSMLQMAPPLTQRSESRMSRAKALAPGTEATAAPAAEQSASADAVVRPGGDKATRITTSHRYMNDMRRGSRGYGHALLMRVAETMLGKKRSAGKPAAR